MKMTKASGISACFKTTRGSAARDFGRSRGGEDRASPEWAVRSEPTKAPGKRPAAQPLAVLKHALTLAALLLGGFNVTGQSYHEYKFIFRGTAYQTNASGDIVGTPITDQTLLQSQAKRLNITDLSTVSLVYHINGGPPYGDTVDVISNATGQTLTYEFGFYFGSDTTLGRYAVTNATQTEERRVDQVYTFNNSPYTYQNSASLGAAYTCKRFLVDTSGNTNSIIEGTLFWDVTPTGTSPASVLCVGNFTLGQPMF